MVGIEINGRKLNVDENSTLLDAINSAKAPYRKDCKIIVISGKAISEPSPSKDFLIETSKGILSVRVADPLFPLWLKYHRNFQGIGIGWTTRNVATFGPVDFKSSGLEINRERTEYSSWDVFLSFGGFDPANAHLCFSKADHGGVYGAPLENRGIIGKVIGGGHVISELGRGDSILRIYPSTVERREVLLLGPEEIEKKAVEDGMRILTYAEAALDGRASNCVEHFLAALKDGFFKVDRASTVFVCNEKFAWISPPKENTVYRSKGAITVRNSGTKAGAIYIYRKDAPFAQSHSLVGMITRGIELVENVNPGDKFLVKTIPERLMMVGMNQRQVTEYLSQRRIRHIRVGDENDDAIIIEQRPKSTTETREQGSAVTLGVDPKLIAHVILWDEDSPKSVIHFRSVADMIYSPIGKLQVLAASDSMLILSSSRETKTIKSIPAEKTPSDVVDEGTIGITNSRRKLTGLIGIRLEADKTYGPTGEAFEATNLVGKVTRGLNSLRNRDVGDTVYLMEEK